MLTPISKWFNKIIGSQIRRTGKAFGTMPSLILTTIGAKSGAERTSPVAYFPDRNGNWLIVASNAGAKTNPSWYHNIAANPQRVRIEVDGHTHNVTAEELHGAEREAAWKRIATESTRFAGYQDKTDRQLPIIRLTALP
ncbi:nitroreductase family deazaflavin-dependent oxidoreductase [Mycolicibacterium novocastrense]|uniref:nitroreductase family deazaflavin-dependent oxidoreductase n=1 Tax=Mycolicibacterium novocastrense TaxID=59813 RepID=UPI0027E28DBD|nr:nitroreductase family deazaflavin-dependent oxidoreductase [Mycolicibacterium novocastrense]